MCSIRKSELLDLIQKISFKFIQRDGINNSVHLVDELTLRDIKETTNPVFLKWVLFTINQLHPTLTIDSIERMILFDVFEIFFMFIYDDEYNEYGKVQFYSETNIDHFLFKEFVFPYIKEKSINWLIDYFKKSKYYLVHLYTTQYNSTTLCCQTRLTNRFNYEKNVRHTLRCPYCTHSLLSYPVYKMN